MPRAERVLRDAKAIIEDCLREGYFPPDLPQKGRAAVAEANSRLATKYGVSVHTARDWVMAARESEHHRPDWSLFRPFQYVGLSGAQKELPAYRPAEALQVEEISRVAVIGDAHDSPALPDKDRFLWMGRWVNDQDFHEVIQIGDFCTLDSLTRHAAPGTRTFADLPSFREDLESLDEALNHFDAGLDGKRLKKTITIGNHEHRAAKYEDNNPQLTGTIVAMLHDIFRSHGWKIIPFGEHYYLHGVAFTHHPINSLGRPVGGKTANQRTGSDSLTSLVHGHDHKLEFHPAAKIGPMGHVDIISVGCSLPHGMVEDYAAHGPSGWAWGVCEFGISQGQILDKSFVSMPTLERKYK